MTMDIELIPEDRLKHFANLMQRAKEMENSELAQKDFLTFVEQTWEGFIHGRHHKIMAEKFNRVATGDLKRVIINYADNAYG